MAEPSDVLQMRSSDGIVFKVSREVAHLMGLTHSWLQMEHEAPMSSDDDDGNIMRMERVSSDIFQLVLNWCQAVLDGDKPDDQQEKLQQYRAIFQNLLRESGANDSTIFGLIIAADYLNVEGLLDAGTQHVADMINGLDSVQAIRERFSINFDGEVTD